MPIIIDAVENYASLGEIADTFRDVFGEYRA
jgi:methylmalonyl-CoA mutase N-terminal domain/subunit